jgi:helicase
LYATSELAGILGVKNIIGVSKRLRTRVAYGISDELFSLVSIKGIGRVRARKLYNNGILSYEDVMNSPTNKLASILGPGIAKKIKED